MPQINRSLASNFPISIVPRRRELRSLLHLRLHKRRLGIRLKLVPVLKLFWPFVILIIFSLLIVSVYQLNAYTAEIYSGYGYGKKINELSQENKILEINLAKANSLWNIGNYVQNFEKAGKIEYIRVLESTVLAK